MKPMNKAQLSRFVAAVEAEAEPLSRRLYEQMTAMPCSQVIAYAWIEACCLTIVTAISSSRAGSGSDYAEKYVMLQFALQRIAEYVAAEVNMGVRGNEAADLQGVREG